MKRTGRAVKPIAVFLGPSLPKKQARALLDADYYPPARKGDVYLIMASGVRTIILIDGVFHNTPSVWQRELLDAMEEGIQVLGASSMGALRAAELHQFGMVGYGTIFEWYRDGIIDGDDEVALWHQPEEHDFRPLSEPLVNIRYTLLKAVEDHCLTPEQAQELTEYGMQVNYPRRSYRQLLNSPIVKEWPQNHVARLEQYFLTKAIDLKMLDAIGMLRYCAGGSLKPGTKKHTTSNRSFQADDSRLWNYERLMMSGFNNSKGFITGAQVLNEAHRDSVLARTMRSTLSQRHFLLEWARQNGVSCPDEVLMTFIKIWEQEHVIGDHSEWLRANGLTEGNYLRLSAERALIHWMMSQGQTYFGLRRSFVLEWARQNGVSSTSSDLDHSVESKEEVLEEWIVNQGPNYFGLNWSFDVALLQELQITGRAANLIKKLEIE